MLDGVWNLIGEISDEVVEAVVWLEDGLLDPKVTVGNEGLSVKIICDSTTILCLDDHVLHSFPGVWNVEGSRHGKMLIDIRKGGFQIGVVELVGDTETKWSELSSLLDDGMHEADGEDEGSPLVIWLDLFKEVLADHGVEGS